MNTPSGSDLGRLEAVIGRLLHAGVVTSSVCLAGGLFLKCAGLLPAVADAVLSAGLVVLLATPIARVVVSAAGYARERDWVFVVLTIGVLVALAGSVFAAFWT